MAVEPWPAATAIGFGIVAVWHAATSVLAWQGHPKTQLAAFAGVLLGGTLVLVTGGLPGLLMSAAPGLLLEMPPIYLLSLGQSKRFFSSIEAPLATEERLVRP